jgi:hypothetical protein
MRGNRRPFILLAALAVAVLALLGWQRLTAGKLRDQIATQRAQGRERARLSAEHRRLAAAQATAAELDALLSERMAVAHLREQLAELRRRAGETAVARPGSEPVQAPSSILGNVAAFTLWKNLGRMTPEASLETALWASANGDIDTLANLLIFDPDAKDEATTFFAQLPEGLRQEFVSPERLIAILAAKDVPLGSATILNQYPTPTETKMTVQIFDAAGKHKMALLSLRPDEAGWRFVVPANAVKRYAAWVQAPPSLTLSPIVTSGNP